MPLAPEAQQALGDEADPGIAIVGLSKGGDEFLHRRAHLFIRVIRAQTAAAQIHRLVVGADLYSRVQQELRDAADIAGMVIVKTNGCLMAPCSHLIQLIFQGGPIKYTLVQMDRIHRKIKPFQAVRKFYISRIREQPLQGIHLRCFTGGDFMPRQARMSAAAGQCRHYGQHQHHDQNFCPS